MRSPRPIVGLLALLALLASLSVQASLDLYRFDNPAQEARFRALTHKLRCLVCQNESLADSDADLAHDLRQEVYEMVRKGQSDQQIIDYLVARYGDFVLYDPPVKPANYPLWFGPFVVLAIAALAAAIAIRRHNRPDRPPLTEEERRRAERLLAGTDNDEGDKS